MEWILLGGGIVTLLAIVGRAKTTANDYVSIGDAVGPKAGSASDPTSTAGKMAKGAIRSASTATAPKAPKVVGVPVTGKAPALALVSVSSTPNLTALKLGQKR